LSHLSMDADNAAESIQVIDQDFVQIWTKKDVEFEDEDSSSDEIELEDEDSNVTQTQDETVMVIMMLVCMFNVYYLLNF